tara:strand:- start:248 stop:562 length:315 start_codon:yes stop_codon:yes gene_type:complete
MKLTESETKVLIALATNHYGGLDDHDPTWSACCVGWRDSINDSSFPSGIEGKALSGVVGSLSKKGLLTSEWYENDLYSLWLTKEGVAAAEELRPSWEASLPNSN